MLSDPVSPPEPNPPTDVRLRFLRGEASTRELFAEYWDALSDHDRAVAKQIGQNRAYGTRATFTRLARALGVDPALVLPPDE